MNEFLWLNNILIITPRQNLKHSVHGEKFVCLPVFVGTVREVSSDDEGHFSFRQLDFSESVRVRLVAGVDH